MSVQLLVIGIGSGQPGHLTGDAIAALRAVDVFLVADKGSAARDLARLREQLCAAVITDHPYRFVAVTDPRRDRDTSAYDEAVRTWHRARAARYAAVIADELPDGGTVGFLVWGDPAFYDSTIRIAEELSTVGAVADFRVVPGVSSVQLLAAAHRIVLNRIGAPVQLTTGRRLLHDLDRGSDLVVMLDGDLACGDLVPLHADLEIFWGAQLGLPDQALVAGPLPEVIDQIRTLRRRIREQRGWVMDTYLLRLPESPD